ncbi:pilus assembly protein TadG-related protein [Chthonobacter rhizosphaerae]|uniref:pilus assembly protein TadG-related protein n=1 Tax=Chthonobacter rhizosphaerae TaxID=2735553 RepID=UPI0015EE3DC4|nr:pilus assembly protein TadG-related protein [Chthonobacter rhizosphaerae]
MTARFLCRLHRDDRGFISPLILFLTIGLAYMILWILNTGQMIADKQRTQNTADAAALVHAEWGARYLNVMAMNNVAATQATVVAVTSTAYAATLVELGLRSATIAAKLTEYSVKEGWGKPAPALPTGAPHCPGYQKIPLVGGFIYGACVAFQAFRGIGAARAAAYVVRANIQYNPVGVAMKSANVIRAMNAMNDYLVNSYPERVANEGLNLVRQNGADHLVYHPACDRGRATSCRQGTEGMGGNLPVEGGALERGVAFAEMCLAATSGTQGFGAGPLQIQVRGEFAKRGFPMGKGPLTAGGIDRRHIRNFVNDAGETAVELPFFYIWYESLGPGYYTKVPFSAIMKQFAGTRKIKVFGFEVDVTGAFLDIAMGVLGKFFGVDLGFVNPFQLPIDEPWPRYGDSQTATTNDFTRKFDKAWNAVCPGGAVAAALKVPVLPTPYWLKGRPFYAHDPVTTRTMADQMTDYRSLALVSRTPKARLQARMFKDKSPAAYAFAESWLHNYTAFDLYTQDWLAALVPAKHMNNARAVSQTVQKSPVAKHFKALTTTMEKGGNNAWTQVNMH